MNMHVSPSAFATAEPIGHPGFNIFLEQYLATLPSDASALIPLYEAYRASAEALHAVLDKPRTRGLATNLIEDEIERANDHACAIAVKLSQLTSVTELWSGPYLETMLSHNFFIGDDSSESLTAVIAKAKALRISETASAPLSPDLEIDHKAILSRVEQIVDLLRTRHAREGWKMDEEGATRTLAYFRRRAEGYPDDAAEWQASADFIRSHGQSLDWICDGDVGGMICRLAAQATTAKRCSA